MPADKIHQLYYNSTQIITQQILQQVLNRTEGQIDKNNLVRFNMQPFSAHYFKQTSNMVVEQLLFNPNNFKIHHQNEPKYIDQDNMMQVNMADQQYTTSVNKHVIIQNKHHQDKKHKEEKDQIHKEKQSKHKKIKQQTTAKQFNQITIKKHEHHNNEIHHQKFIDQMRIQKVQQQKANLALKSLVRAKPSMKITDKDRIIFDYEGNAKKGKESNINYLDNKALQGDVIKQQKTQVNKLDDVKKNLKNMKIMLINKVNQKIQSKKSIQNYLSDTKQIQFSDSKNREDIIKSLHITQEGIKMTFDGQVVKNQNKSKISQHKHRNQVDAPSFQQLQIKKKSSLNESTNQRMKTQMANNSLKQSITMKIYRKQSKLRANTEIGSNFSNYRHRIFVQNENLKYFLLPHGDQVQAKHINLPSHRSSAKRRVKTNLDKSDKSDRNYFAQLKKERINVSSLKKQHLPRIMTQYKQAEKELLKSIRKKLNS